MHKRPLQRRRVDPAYCPYDDRLRLLDVFGEEKRGQDGGNCERRQQRADERERVGARHRTENLPFNALHREQGDEGRDCNQPREKNRLVNL